MISKAKAKWWKYLYMDKPGLFDRFVKSTDQKQRQETIIFEKLKKVVKSNSSFSILDVGCADGTLSFKLYRKLLTEYKGQNIEFEIYLLDPSEIMIQISKKKFKVFDQQYVHFTVGGIGGKELPNELKNKKFDFILASFIFFWIEDWQRAIAQILSLSKHNGKIIISGPSEKAKLKGNLVKVATGCEVETVEAIQKVFYRWYPDKFQSIETYPFNSPFDFPREFISKMENGSPLSETDKDHLAILEFLMRTSWISLDESNKKAILENLKQTRDKNDFLCEVMEVNAL